jgi:hypothetical protein
MDVCVFILSVGSRLVTCGSPVWRVLLTVYRIKKLKKQPRSKGMLSHRERKNVFLICPMHITCPNHITSAILSPEQHFIKSINYNYAIFSNLLLLPLSLVQILFPQPGSRTLPIYIYIYILLLEWEMLVTCCYMKHCVVSAFTVWQSNFEEDSVAYLLHARTVTSKHVPAIT